MALCRSIFQATDQEYIELVEDYVSRVGENHVHGIHATLYYDYKEKSGYLPESKREIDRALGQLNEAQRALKAKLRAGEVCGSDNGCISPPNCVTLCHMKRTTVRELHLQTSAIVRAVAEGESFIVEKSGVPVAELRPLEQASTRRKLPNREAIISKMPRVGDSGRILEEDRS